MSKMFFIIAGETSGDLFGSQLAKALFKKPDSEVFGVGGSCMEETGVRLIYHIRKLSVMGFSDVIAQLPKLFRLQKKLLEDICRHRPDAVILIDFPDFNLRLAKKIRQHRLVSKIYYYIPPQVWIWRANRIFEIKKYCDAVFPIFVFEHQLYETTGIRSYFFGHPITTRLNQYPQKPSEKQADALTISLLPGSRLQEVKRILPVMLQAVAKLQAERKGELQINISLASEVNEEIYDKILERCKAGLEDIYIRISKETYEMIQQADVILSKSGTVNLEIAFFEKPFIVLYKTSWLNFLIAKILANPRFISLVNILGQKEIVREFVQLDCSAVKVKKELQKILNDLPYRDLMISEVKKIKKSVLDTRQSVPDQIADVIHSNTKKESPC